MTGQVMIPLEYLELEERMPGEEGRGEERREEEGRGKREERGRGEEGRGGKRRDEEGREVIFLC
jgi:hypothetical protein